MHIDIFCPFVALKILSIVLRCGHAAKQRVIAKFISNETLQSVAFACYVGTGPSPGFRSKGPKTTRAATFLKYNIECMQLRGSKHAKNVLYGGSTNAQATY